MWRKLNTKKSHINTQAHVNTQVTSLAEIKPCNSAHYILITPNLGAICLAHHCTVFLVLAHLLRTGVLDIQMFI